MDENRIREIPFASETIYEGKILHVERWQVTCPNGRSATREIVVHKGAAAVVPVYPDGTTLLVRQHRVAVDRVTLEIPAGKLEKGEEPYSAALRELREETGGLADKLEYLGAYYGSAGFCDEKLDLYFARLDSTGAADPDEDEFLTVERYPLADFEAMIARGEIADGKTLSAYTLARAAGRI